MGRIGSASEWQIGLVAHCALNGSMKEGDHPSLSIDLVLQASDLVARSPEFGNHLIVALSEGGEERRWDNSGLLVCSHIEADAAGRRSVMVP